MSMGGCRTHPSRDAKLWPQGVPVEHRVAPRRASTGTLDLTATTLFVTGTERHALIAAYARDLNKLITFEKGQINLGSAMTLFLRTLHALHAMWRQKEPFTPSDLQSAGGDWWVSWMNTCASQSPPATNTLP